MVTQYSAKVDLDITNPNGPVSDFEDSIYKLTANQDDLPVKEKIIEDEITIYDLRKRDATQQEAFLGQSSFRYSEFPYKNIDDSKAFLSKIAKRQNLTTWNDRWFALSVMRMTARFREIVRSTNTGLKSSCLTNACWEKPPWLI
jgi:hypothetical protein